MLLTSSDTKRTLMHLFLFTNHAQRELVSICMQSIRNCNYFSLHYSLGSSWLDVGQVLKMNRTVSPAQLEVLIFKQQNLDIYLKQPIMMEYQTGLNTPLKHSKVVDPKKYYQSMEVLGTNSKK